MIQSGTTTNVASHVIISDKGGGSDPAKPEPLVSPNTGDDMSLWATVLLVCIVGTVSTLSIRRKHN